MLTKLKTMAKRELSFFRDAPLLAVVPDKEISVLVGAGAHLYVQATHWPDRSRQEQEVETANTLLRAAQMMAASAGAVMVQHGPPPATPEGAPNG